MKNTSTAYTRIRGTDNEEVRTVVSLNARFQLSATSFQRSANPLWLTVDADG
jgi:hypothetical protein